MQTLLLVDDEPNIVEGLPSQFEGRYGGDAKQQGGCGVV